ncbi:unnamed protein product, partial [marine sediment metagenome]
RRGFDDIEWCNGEVRRLRHKYAGLKSRLEQSPLPLQHDPEALSELLQSLNDIQQEMSSSHKRAVIRQVVTAMELDAAARRITLSLLAEPLTESGQTVQRELEIRPSGAIVEATGG